jgi:hypothetical protein
MVIIDKNLPIDFDLSSLVIEKPYKGNLIHNYDNHIGYFVRDTEDNIYFLNNELSGSVIYNFEKYVDLLGVTSSWIVYSCGSWYTFDFNVIRILIDGQLEFDFS